MSGSQSKLPSSPLPRHGAEPSGGALDRAARAALGSGRTRGRRGAASGGSAVSTSPAGVCAELEGVEDRLDAGVVAVGVVVGGALAELREPAGQVGRVRADVLDHRLRVAAARSIARGNDASSSASASFGACWLQLDQVVARAGRADQRAQVAGSSGARRAPAGAARAGTARGRAWRASTRPPARRGRRASRAGSRTSCSRCAACPAGGRARGASATFSSPIAPRGGVGVADQRGQVVAALGERGDDAARRR